MPDILILGAGSDIAIACSKKFAQQGYNVWLCGRNISSLNAQAADLKIRYKTQVSVLPFDALDTAKHKAFVESLAFVPDVVLLAFGYLGDQKIAESDWDESSKIIESNFTGAISILNETANLLEKHKTGVIVGISSIAGNRGKKSNYIYGAAKAGLTAYLSGLRNRLFSSNVHVVTVLPGFVDTKMTAHMPLPKAITAQPDAVADSIYKAVKSKKNVIYTKPVWRYIMLIIGNIPEFIYKKLSIG